MPSFRHPVLHYSMQLGIQETLNGDGSPIDYITEWVVVQIVRETDTMTTLFPKNDLNGSLNVTITFLGSQSFFDCQLLSGRNFFSFSWLKWGPVRENRKFLLSFLSIYDVISLKGPFSILLFPLKTRDKGCVLPCPAGWQRANMV